MQAVKLENMNKIAPLFKEWDESFLLSCMQGYMGKAWADDAETPNSGQIIVGDFCFFAGVPNMELVKNIPVYFFSESILMIPQNGDWALMIEDAYENCEKTFRYSIKKEPDVFDRSKLESYIKKILPDYKLKIMDETLYNRAKAEQWSKDLCSQFQSYQEYQLYGIGVMVLHGDLPISGASSYIVYDKGIEIEVDTKKEYRRCGLALACAAKLILECMDRGLYPSWDAHDMRSVLLAEKLGYHRNQRYATYIVSNFR